MRGIAKVFKKFCKILFAAHAYKEDWSVLRLYPASRPVLWSG
jgi:hypothetical protein